MVHDGPLVHRHRSSSSTLPRVSRGNTYTYYTNNGASLGGRHTWERERRKFTNVEKKSGGTFLSTASGTIKCFVKKCGDSPPTVVSSPSAVCLRHRYRSSSTKQPFLLPRLLCAAHTHGAGHTQMRAERGKGGEGKIM